MILLRNVKNLSKLTLSNLDSKALKEFSNSKGKTLLENEEDIEILRFLELGYEVRMIEMSNVSIPVDHQEDLQKVIKKLQNV